MLKCLFATCLTALSVNSQALPVSRSIEPSNAITQDTTFNVGDTILLSVDFTYDTSISEALSIFLFANGDSGIDTLKFLGYSIPYNVTYSNSSSFNILTTFDLCSFLVISPLRDDDLLYFDNSTDDTDLTIRLSGAYNFTYTATFEILEGFEGFNTEALPYLTKVEQPYTPPAKSNLYRLLYDFYYSIFNDDDLTAITTGYNMPFDNWLAHTCTIATLITLIVVAFFFLRWLFKVISGLLLLKR